MAGKKGRRASLQKLFNAIWEAPRRSLSRLSQKSAPRLFPYSTKSDKASQSSSGSPASHSSHTTEPHYPNHPPKHQSPSAVYTSTPRKISPLVRHRDSFKLSPMEANRRWVQGYLNPEDDSDDAPPLLSDFRSSRVVDLVIQYEQQSGRPYTGPGAAWVAEAKAARQTHDEQVASAVPQPSRDAENQPTQGRLYNVPRDKTETLCPMQTTESSRKAPQSTAKQASPRRIQELSEQPKPSPPKAAYTQEARVSLTQRSKTKDQENVMACQEVKSTKGAPVPTSDVPSEASRDSPATNSGTRLQPSDHKKVTEAQPPQYWLGRLVTLVNAFHYEDSFHHPDIATGFSMLSSYSRPLGDVNSKPSYYRTKRAFMVLENECVTDEAAASLCEFRQAYIRRYGDRWME